MNETDAERRLRAYTEELARGDEAWPASMADTATRLADACDIGREALALLRAYRRDLPLATSGDGLTIGDWQRQVRALLSRAGQAQEGR